MKKFIEITAAVKNVGAMIFTGLIYTVFGGFFGFGEISFSSEPGEGARVRFALPVYKREERHG